MLVFGFFLTVAALLTAQSAKSEDPMLTATLTSDRTDYLLSDDIRTRERSVCPHTVQVFPRSLTS
jgi:hypothetical protein